MWRGQHGISPKTTEGPFVLCHHAELDHTTTAIAEADSHLAAVVTIICADFPTCKKEKHVHAAHATLMSPQEKATAYCRASHYGLALPFHAARLLQ